MSCETRHGAYAMISGMEPLERRGRAWNRQTAARASSARTHGQGRTAIWWGLEYFAHPPLDVVRYGSEALKADLKLTGMSDKRRHRMRGAGQQKEALRGVGGAMRGFGGHKHKATPGTGFQSEPGYPARQHSSPGRMPLHAAERGCHVGETLRESVTGGRRWRHGPWEQVCACVLLVRRGRYCWWEEAGAEGGGTDSSDRARRARRGM